ncbi:MAG: repair protein RecN [Solirubrobacteraceae bacterium]|jgi:DNA repair protein RecN (Recombination protein N)|nr:repair protein RecN [Solirubrobacteraceae bacterium]
MLNELRVENLLLLERAELRLVPGLNVLTGETGAGKTVLAHALDLLLGGRARSGIVRPGAREAWVEGAFELSDALRAQLGERLPADAEELVLARRVSAEGRTRAYVNGRAAGVAELRDLASGLLAFYGQHEHRKLTLASAQLDVLDGFCGPAQAARREAYAAAWGRAREARGALEALRERAGSRDRELDLLLFELDEIEAAGPDEAEERELTAERDRLRHLEGLRAAALAGAEAVTPEGGGSSGDSALAAGGPGAAALLAEALGSLDALSGVDARLDALAERLRAAQLELEDAGAELRSYEQEVEGAPGCLEEVEERLAVLDRLRRKHGGTIAAVLEHAERCRARRDELAGAEEAIGEAEATLGEAEAELGELAGALGDARREAAPRLAEAVRERLAELAMEGAEFEVALADRDAPGPTGAESVELLIAPNPGVPAAPLREIASGGELSRVMLALTGVAAESGPLAGEDEGAAPAGAAPLLVFDEVDAGIGGHTARAVGERLRALSRGRRVLCITHLPQVASLADRHFRIEKDTSADPALATVEEVTGAGVVEELVRMLGADGDDAGARKHARELLRAA